MAKTKRPKATLREKSVEKNCFVDGCQRVHGECKGIPMSNDCAACRLKKNYMGIPM